jgi:hypothetical protein
MCRFIKSYQNDSEFITLLSTYYLFNEPSEYNNQMLKKLSTRLNMNEAYEMCVQEILRLLPHNAISIL